MEMDKTVINSLTGISAPDKTKKKATGKEQADAFSKVLDDAVSKKDPAEAADNIIDEPDASETEKKGHLKSHKAKATSTKKPKANPTANHNITQQGKLKDYLHHLVYKDPSTLSISQRQALKVGEFSRLNLGTKELLEMLHMKGINLETLDTDNLAKLLGDKLPNDQDLEALLHELRKLQANERKNQKSSTQLQGHLLEDKSLTAERLLNDATPQGEAAQKAQFETTAEKRQQLIDQILQKIEVRNLANQTEINLRLNPAYLGELKINLIHDEEGVKAHFETTSRTTRQLLIESENELMTRVRDKGIKLNKVGIKLVEDLT